jgi:hypothetical protein
VPLRVTAGEAKIRATLVETGVALLVDSGAIPLTSTKPDNQARRRALLFSMDIIVHKNIRKSEI